jgi:hypothetical protein
MSDTDMTSIAESPMQLRFLVFHVHRVSARLRYLTMPYGQLCMPTPLPKLAELMDERPQFDKLAIHPGTWLKQACEQMQLPLDRLSVEPGFRRWIDTPGQPTQVYILRVSGPSPFAAPEGMRWIELPDCLSMLPIERLLMQSVYQYLLE